MHFNSKYIFQGDSKTEIVDKINYNFNQIVSFAVGPDGNNGNIGLTGPRGPAGKKGIAGGSGERASIWYKQSNQPTGSLNQYDLWINTASTNGDVSAYSATGSWNFTGFSIFDSNFFSAYSYILGPAGVVDKNVIGLSDVANAANQTLVITDSALTTANSNPNRSKVVVSTSDQTGTPIFTFGKSGAISTSIPSFYWENSGSTNDLIFRSNGGYDVTSLLNFEINSSSAATLLQGNNFNSNSVSFNLRGAGDFYLNANTTIGAGANLAIATQNLNLTSQYLTYGGPVRVSGSNPGGYVVEDLPQNAQLAGGISMDVTFKATDSFRFEDFTGNPVLSGKPSGSYPSGDFAQTIFGSTGSGYTGGTAGSYSYHVQKLRRISAPGVAANAFVYPTTVSPVLIDNVVDISTASLWDRNIITVTPTAFTSTAGVYLRVPSTNQNTLDPVFSPARANYYRVLLNTTNTNPSSILILGLVFTVTDYSQNPNNPTNLLSYVTFSSPCSYVDLQWISVANLFNANPRLFYKTCVGSGGYINLTNYFTVGSPPPPPPPASGGGGGGGGGYGGGGFGGGGCFLAGTQICLPEGLMKAIEEINSGDLVLSYDFETGSTVVDRVVDVFKYIRGSIVEIGLANGTSMSSTPDHPYWVIGKGWCSAFPEATFENYEICAKQLEPGDLLLTADLAEVAISEIHLFEGEIQTFNFHTARTQNYFANRVLVHNKISFVENII